MFCLKMMQNGHPAGLRGTYRYVKIEAPRQLWNKKIVRAAVEEGREGSSGKDPAL